MSPDDLLAQLADRLGIFPEFKDMQGNIHRTNPDTQRALLQANGVEIENDGDLRAHLRFFEEQHKRQYVAEEVLLRAGKACHLNLAAPAQWTVVCDGTGDLIAEGRAETRIDLPPLPDGVHDLHLAGARGDQHALLISAPETAPALDEATGVAKAWGVTTALYGLASDPPKSLGDFGDLKEFAKHLGSQGAAFLGINPVHALGEATTDAISPYSPTHRGFLNADHIACRQGLENVCGSELLDYAGHRKSHRQALKAAFVDFSHLADDSARAAFEGFCQRGGTALRDFAKFEALSLMYGTDSRLWPATATDVEIDPSKVEFAMWQQWQADTQLAAAQSGARGAGMSLGLYLDLAVGARLGGAESWGKQAATATGVSLGAPPDHLSPAGQNWQLSALSPRRLRAGRFEAFRFVLQQNMRHCGLIRIDHALGLNRSFWLPEDGTPGAYIRQPFDVLMAIIAIEARRSGTVVVGEDLGLVPQGFREAIARNGLYGYSVLQYEKDRRGNLLPVGDLRPHSLACFGTHDTPTLEGFWQGRDIKWWERLGWTTPSETASAMDKRQSEKRQLAGLSAPAPLPKRAGSGVRDTVHAALASSPAALVAIQLDDILCLEEAQNLPGTIDEHPNWRRVYPKTITEIGTSPDLEKTAKIMQKAGRNCIVKKETT